MNLPIKIQMLLWFLKNHKGTKIDQMSPAQARHSAAKIGNMADMMIDFPAIPLHKIKDQLISGRNGDIPIRIYQSIDKKSLPVIMYFHGGGFVINNIETHDKICRRIARDNNAVVVSVDYRLAPEHKFPAGLHDAYDATVWAAANAAAFNGDASRLIVMGDSAGGNLATVICLMARDLDGPAIFYQVIAYPCTDGTLSYPSIDALKEGYFLEKNIILWFQNHYLNNKEEIYNPYVSPVFAKNLSNLPPALVITAEYDPLKDEGKKYADLLKAAGNDVIHKEYEGLIHSFLGMARLSKKILTAYQDIQSVLEKALKKEPTNNL